MMTQCLQIAEPLRVRSRNVFKRAAHALVQLGPARDEEVLVYGLVHECVRKAIAAGLAPMVRLPDQFCSNETVEHSQVGRIRHYSAQKILFELCTQHGCLLQEASSNGWQAVYARKEESL